MAWINNDGLKVKFDVEKVAEQAHRGESPGAGEYRVISVKAPLAETTAATPFVFDNVIIPRNSLIEQVETVVITTATGGTAFDFGLTSYDWGEYDYDGFIDGATTLTAGTKTVYVDGTSGHGALVGTVLAYPGYLTVTPTGQFTAGLIEFRVKIFVPYEDANRNNWEA